MTANRDAKRVTSTRHASHVTSDTFTITFPQVVTRVTRKPNNATKRGVTRVTRSPRFHPTRTRTYVREQTNHG